MCFVPLVHKTVICLASDGAHISVQPLRFTNCTLTQINARTHVFYFVEIGEIVLRAGRANAICVMLAWVGQGTEIAATPGTDTAMRSSLRDGSVIDWHCWRVLCALLLCGKRGR